MKILLIVGRRNDIFINNMAKWLKRSMPDLELDVFDFYPTDAASYSDEYYTHIGEGSDPTGWYCHFRGVSSIIGPVHEARQLETFLKGHQYDIIQCHWIVSPLVLVNSLKQHSKKICITFWGGEMEQQKLLFSPKIYCLYLKHFLTQVDYVINGVDILSTYPKVFSKFKGSLLYGRLGSSPLETVYRIMDSSSKTEAKQQLGIPTNKQTVLIGYSGKDIHQHLSIISALQKHPALKEQLHLLAPMTRGADASYVDQVASALKQSNYSYTLWRDRYLSDEEIGLIRCATDIMFQFSIWDGFSRSVIECLCAKAVVFYGSWIDYDPYLQESGFEALSAESIEQGIERLEEMIANPNNYQKMIDHNHTIGRTRYLWSECIKDWVNAYNKMITEES